MAEYLASIFGTEKDKVNCSFYFKIGACRHGERCSRIHNKPTFSQTILLQNLYQNPQNVTQNDPHGGRETTIQRVQTMSDEEAQEHFDDFFEDVFVELEDKYGEIEEMNVCDNLGDHLVGNVYVKFRREEDAERAVNDLNNRWFGGRPIYAELSPVTDFREACCRQYEMGECTRSGFCNFMHIKPISRELRRELYGRRRADALERRHARSRSMERSRGRSRDRDYRDRRERDRSRDRDRDKRKSSRRHRSKSRSRSKDRDRSHRSHRSHRSRRSRSKDRDREGRDRERSKDRDHRDIDDDSIMAHQMDDNANQSYANNYNANTNNDSQDGYQQMNNDSNDVYNSNSGINSYAGMIASGGGGQSQESSMDNYNLYENYQRQQQNYYNNGDEDDDDNRRNDGEEDERQYRRYDDDHQQDNNSQHMMGGLYGSYHQE